MKILIALLALSALAVADVKAERLTVETGGHVTSTNLETKCSLVKGAEIVWLGNHEGFGPLLYVANFGDEWSTPVCKQGVYWAGFDATDMENTRENVVKSQRAALRIIAERP